MFFNAALYHGLFQRHADSDRAARLSRHEAVPAAIPCPKTGRPLRIATTTPTRSPSARAAPCTAWAALCHSSATCGWRYAGPECRQLVCVNGV